MTNATTKATHANVHATSMCFGGFRATVMAGTRVVSSMHFPTKGWGQKLTDASYVSMKNWLAQFGVA